MPNITLTVSDDVYRSARIAAAEQGRSVSALVADYLRSLTDRSVQFDRLEALQASVPSEIEHFDGGDRLTRDEVYDRSIP